MSLSGGDVLLDSFERHGIEQIFCSPGSEWVPVWEGLAKRQAAGDKAMGYINCRHEILAVSAAMGYAKASGRMPAVLLHAGVGPLHAAMAIRAATRAQVPMLICTGDTSGQGEDYQDSDRHWLSLLSDIGGPHALVGPCAKWSNVVASNDALMDSIHRGCQIALRSPQGPVFLSIARGLLLETLPEQRTAPSFSPPAPSEPRLQDLEEVAKRLLESRQPIIITEYAGKSPNALGKLVELAELLNIPVFESMDPSVANFPRTHALHMGYDPVEALQEADTVLIVGATTPWYPPSAFPRNGARVILLDEDPAKAQLPYWGYPVDLSIEADIGHSLAALVDRLRDHRQGGIKEGVGDRKSLEQWRYRRRQMAEGWEREALAGKNKKPISPKWFLYLLNKVMPGDAIIVEENITHKPFILRYLTVPDTFFRTSTGGLGIGFGMAAGTQLACKNRPVIFLVGDGCFNYNPALTGLGLCQEYRLPVLTIVLNNGGYVSMKRTHQECYPEGWAVRDNRYFGVSIAPEPDYAKVAEACGAYSERVEDPEDIEPALNRAFQQVKSGRAALLDVKLDPGRNV